jgi:DNA polymerase IV
MRVVTSLNWLFLDLNSYFASVEQQLDPALRGRPVAVVPVDSDATSAIAASYQAKAFGVKTGTRIYEARKMCPGLIVVNAQHNRYVEFHHRILAAIDKHLPVTRVCSIDEVACQLMGSEREPENAMRIARAMKAGIRRDVGECLTSSVGIAPNAFLAKIASDMQKPDGLTVIPPDRIFETIGQLSLHDLPGVGANMYQRLLRANVPDMHTLWHLQPKQARAIWGSIIGERLWWELHGHDIPVTPTKRSTLGHSHVLAPSLRPPAHARQVTRRLLTKAASRLRRMEMATGALVLSVRLEDGRRLAFEDLFVPTQDSFALLATLEKLWAQLATQLRRGDRLKKTGVVLHKLCPPDMAQGDLFATPTKKALGAERLKLAGAIDKLNGKYGKDTISFGLWNSDVVNKFTGTKIAFTRIPDMAEFHE